MHWLTKFGTQQKDGIVGGSEMPVTLDRIFSSRQILTEGREAQIPASFVH